MPGTGGCWRVPHAASFVHHCWPGESEHLVFVPASGELHLLTGLAAALLGHLSEFPTDVRHLVTVTGQSEEIVEAVLASLDRVGLVAPCR